jgi:hypothetical protein
MADTDTTITATPAASTAPATTTAATPEAPAIDQGAEYRVTLRTSIRVGRAKVNPGPRVLLRGDILSSVIASDASIVTDYKLA